MPTNPLLTREERDAMRARDGKSLYAVFVECAKQCGFSDQLEWERLPAQFRPIWESFHSRTDLPRLLAGYKHLLELLRAADGHLASCSGAFQDHMNGQVYVTEYRCTCKLAERRAALKGAEDGI